MDRKKLNNRAVLGMVLCCAVPLGGLGVLLWTGMLGSWGYYGLLLLCPIMHVGMMLRHRMAQPQENIPAPEAAVQTDDRDAAPVIQPSSPGRADFQRRLPGSP